MIKTGAQHIASLKDGREIFIDGRLVEIPPPTPPLPGPSLPWARCSTSTARRKTAS